MTARENGFSCVAAAVAAWWGTPERSTIDRITIADRNRLLDACGSDRRPVLACLLDGGAIVVPALQRGAAREPRGEHQRDPGASIARDAWETQRAPLVHRLMSERFLQAEMARWIVDVWAMVCGVIPGAWVTPPDDVAATDVGTSAPAPLHRRAQLSAAPTPTPRPVLRKSTSRVARIPTMRASPSASAPARAASPASTGAARLRVHRWIVGQLTVLLMFAAATVTATIDSDGARETGSRAVFGAAKDEASVQDTARDTSLQDAARDTSAEAPMPPVPPVAPSPTAGLTGYAGSYRVERRLEAMAGTRECARVARTIANDDATLALERVAHAPGAGTIEFVGRLPRGRVAPDGHFEIGPARGTRDGVRWTFRMRGIFGANGFIAESHAETDVVLAWRRTQRCVARFALRGTRVGP